MEIYASAQQTQMCKADASPLTEADLAAHEILVRGLAVLTPGLAIFSEEGDQSACVRPQSGQFWLLDPLDGTKEFISRNGQFTVNVALVDAGRPVFGVVVAPALAQTYWGAPAVGAFRADAAGVTAIGVTAKAGERPLRVIASKSHMNAETEAFIAGLGECELLQAGSSLKFCRIAEGEADIYPRLGPTCEWDTAAAHAIVEAAGGVVRTHNGDPLVYGKSEVLNPYFIVACSAHATLINRTRS